MGNKIVAESGIKYGRLTVIKEVESRFSPSGMRIRQVLCQCDCGNQTVVSLYELIRKTRPVKSCGCISRELASENFKKYNSSRKGIARIKINDEVIKNRQTKKRLQNILKCMKDRCYLSTSDSYKYYGAKGVKICKEWLDDSKSFYDWALHNGYQNDLTIDRIDTNKDYSPENCRWVTKKVQANNTSKNIYIKNKKGEVKTLTEWSEYYNVSVYRLYSKYRRHNLSQMCIEDVMDIVSKRTKIKK